MPGPRKAAVLPWVDSRPPTVSLQRNIVSDGIAPQRIEIPLRTDRCRLPVCRMIASPGYSAALPEALFDPLTFLSHSCLSATTLRRAGHRHPSASVCRCAPEASFSGNFSQNRNSVSLIIAVTRRRLIRVRLAARKGDAKPLFRRFSRVFLDMNTYDVYFYLGGRTQILKVEASTTLEAKAIAETRLGITEKGFDPDRRVFAVSERKSPKPHQQ